MKKYFCHVLPLLLMPLLSAAHPGHGETEGFSVIHYLLEPKHSLVIIGALVVCVLYVKTKKQQKDHFGKK